MVRVKLRGNAHVRHKADLGLSVTRTMRRARSVLEATDTTVSRMPLLECFEGEILEARVWVPVILRTVLIAYAGFFTSGCSEKRLAGIVTTFAACHGERSGGA